MKRILGILASVIFAAAAFGQVPCQSGYQPASPGSNCCVPIPPPQPPAITNCTRFDATDYWGTSNCVATPSCSWALGQFGAGYYGTLCSVAPPPEPPPPAGCVPLIPAFPGCPVAAQPDALNPPGSPWLFYGYRIVGYGAAHHAITATPVGLFNPDLHQPFHPNKWMTRNCRASGNWPASFRGWILPPSYHCGDMGGFSQACNTPAAWCPSPGTPGGFIYKADQ